MGVVRGGHGKWSAGRITKEAASTVEEKTRLAHSHIAALRSTDPYQHSWRHQRELGVPSGQWRIAPLIHCPSRRARHPK
jgi:hypothetical protein